MKRSVSVAAVTGAGGGAVAAAGGAPTTGPEAGDDPVLPLFRAWRAAERAYEAAVEKRLAVQDAVEARFGASGPRVRLGEAVSARSGAPRPLYATCDGEIEAWFSARKAGAPGQGAAQIAAAVAELRAERARWHRLRAEAGLPALETAEDAESWREHHLSEDIVAARCTTPDGAAAKLRVALHYLGGEEGDEDYPWPILTSLLRDLEAMRASA